MKKKTPILIFLDLKKKKKSSLGMGCLVFIIGRNGYSLKGDEYECLGDSNS